MELQRDNYTSPISGKDRVVVYWSSGISVSVSISEQMLDIIFEAPIFLLGDHIKGLFGKNFVVLLPKKCINKVQYSKVKI